MELEHQAPLILGPKVLAPGKAAILLQLTGAGKGCALTLSLSLSEVFGAVIRKRHLIRGAFLRALVQDQCHRKHTGPHEIQSMRLSPLGMFRQSPDIGGFGAPPFGTSGLGHTGT